MLRTHRLALILLMIGLGACSTATSDPDDTEVAASKLLGNRTTMGIFRPEGTQFRWMLRNDNSGGNPDADFLYGSQGDKPVVGDWNGDTSSTIGIFRAEGSDFRWMLRNANTSGNPDHNFLYGATGDKPVVGDWDGNGTTTIGVFRAEGSGFRWMLRDANTSGNPDYNFLYGATGDLPVAGDWDGSGTVTVGIVRPEGSGFRWMLRNSNTAGNPDYNFLFGATGDIPVVGDWDGSGTTTAGVFRPSTNQWFLRNSNSAGGADVPVFSYGTASIGDLPVAGAWPVTNLEPVASAVTWTATGFAGSLGTFLADVDGDGKADAIALNSDGILVRRSSGGAPLLDSQSWSGAFTGSKATFFADVTGDGKADAIAVNASDVRVHPSTGTSFSTPTPDIWYTGGIFGDIGNDVADVNGDGKADIIALSTGGIVVGISTGSSFNQGSSWSSAFFGGVGTFFKDVTGDRRADVIAVNATNIKVRRAPSTGSGFGADETWSTTGFSGSRSTLLADVTGDGLADAVAVNTDGITMRRSGRWFFGTNVEMLSSAPTAASVTSALADLTGDKRADYVELSASAPVRVRVRQDRNIPVRFVQLVSSCSSGDVKSDQAVLDVIGDANRRYRDAAISFFPQPIADNSECPALGLGLSRVVVAPALSDISPGAPGMPPPTSAGQTEATRVKEAVNPACDMGFSDFANVSRDNQLWWLSSRCARAGEALVFVTVTGSSSFAGDAGIGKMIVLTPGDGFNVSAGRFPHEMGHYLGLPHTFDVGLFGVMDPLTGQRSATAAFWDLVFQDMPSPTADVFFNSRSEAFANEMQLQRIESNGGWFCPGGTVCPATPPPAGTIGVPPGGVIGQIIYTFLANITPATLDSRTKGLAPHPGDFATQPQFHVPQALPGLNFMSYGYTFVSGSPPLPANLAGWLSLSQIEVIQNVLKVDVPTSKLDATGHVLFGDRPRLGTTAPAATLTYVATGGVAAPGQGRLASNGDNTWVVGTNGFNSDGNQVYRWNPRTRGWEGKLAGANQLSLPSDGSDVPWAITGTSARVKTWDGSSFQNLQNDSTPSQCARSLAVGNHSSGTFAWVLTCASADGAGNFPIKRYDGTGWQTVAGPQPGTVNGATDLAVEWDGVLWAIARKAGQPTVFRATMGSNGLPSSWSEFAPPAGTTVTHLTGGSKMNGDNKLPVNIANSANVISIFNKAGSSWSTATSPAFVVRDVAGALPYLWVINNSDGTIHYAR
jgi:hypothetical protein